MRPDVPEDAVRVTVAAGRISVGISAFTVATTRCGVQGETAPVIVLGKQTDATSRVGSLLVSLPQPDLYLVQIQVGEPWARNAGAHWRFLTSREAMGNAAAATCRAASRYLQLPEIRGGWQETRGVAHCAFDRQVRFSSPHAEELFEYYLRHHESRALGRDEATRVADAAALRACFNSLSPAAQRYVTHTGCAPDSPQEQSPAAGI